jgi:hypothetical protein
MKSWERFEHDDDKSKVATKPISLAPYFLKLATAYVSGGKEQLNYKSTSCATTVTAQGEHEFAQALMAQVAGA